MRSVRASLFLLSLTSFAAACGDDSGGSGGGTGSGGAGVTGSTTAAGTTTGAATVGSTSAASTTGSSSSSSGGGAGGSSSSSGGGGEGGGTGGSTSTGGLPCESELFADPDLNECAGQTCCAEMTVCDPNLGGDVFLCFDQDGQLDVSLPDGAALNDCILASRCFGAFAEWCDSGIGYQDPDADALAHAECITESCCDPLYVCTDDGNDVQGCLDCLNGENANFDQCTALNECSTSACDTPLISIPICDTGLSFPSVEVGTCLSDNCCADFTDCVGNGSDAAIQACIDCFAEEPLGALCAPAAACQEANCSTAICDSGLVIDDIELAACLSTSCCAEHTACTGDGSEQDVQLCIDCFAAITPDDPAGPLCAAADACQTANCGAGGGGAGGGGG